MIKYETIISNFDDKTTLYNWLRKVEETLKNASATNFVVNKKGNATLSFSITFADGTTLESGDIVLQQGESVDGARIASGVLQLHLTNGTWLTAGNLGAVSGFSINASQHLIVTYQDGTTQDLGAIFTGDVSITGAFEQGQANYSGEININLHPILTGCTLTKLYCRAQKINQKLSIVLNFSIENDTGADITSAQPKIRLASMYNSLPANIASKLYDMLGHSVAEISDPDQVLIASAKALCYDGYLLTDPSIDNNFEVVLTNREYANVYDISFVSGQNGFTIENGHTYYFTGRITLDLL